MLYIFHYHPIYIYKILFNLDDLIFFSFLLKLKEYFFIMIKNFYFYIVNLKIYYIFFIEFKSYYNNNHLLFLMEVILILMILNDA